MKTITGKSVNLRSYKLDDARSIYEWWNDDETTKWMGRKFRESQEYQVIEERLRGIIENPPEDALFYAIASKGTDLYIGGIDLTSIDLVDKNAILSVVIGKRQDRSKGYGSEAVGLILKTVFSELELHKVELNVRDRNAAAICCYKKMGFVEEGRRKDHAFINGSFNDIIHMLVFSAEFKSLFSQQPD
ncbi:MAG: GNAT family N-acetyltransferase [Chitinivibrionales bacterium]|nr:GNAT family N-acetyltransferase [Chitinivibrionales bacterium]